jgi:folate-binding protein YgfZ
VIATSEYELVTEAVGAVDRSERAKFLVRGSEAADFLQGQVSNDVEAVEPWRGCYATLLNHKGKVRADMRILRSGDGYLLESEGIARPVLMHMLETYSLGRDVRFKDLSDERVVTALIGPEAREVLDVAPPVEEHASVQGEHGFYVTTDLGVDVIAHASVRDALGVEPVSEETAECLRIESGRPRLGFEMGDDTIPEEAGLNDRAVSFEKGCYVGQETVARLHFKGKPNRHLRGLRLAAPTERGEEIRLGDKAVGKVGSTSISPALGPIALALVRREASPGDTVAVGDVNSGELVELPFARA